jgi:division protein CdvB (Snf7/Vps24/ESCRT-III family)
MTMQISIKDQYLEQFNKLMKSLPKDAVVIKKSLDEEVNKRVEEYRNGEMETAPFGTGFDKIRENLVSKL